ncbi:hypothetical protein CDAR_578751 [Caerostris darwini]|uniref:Uncharacterized protein n=1 Tax=Caerostris darwini TaxID=1538125 RepID=A0AAV4UC08_9ARAC|nr:hypothetical protein CDAR_578751 [Caerostris darwini]
MLEINRRLVSYLFSPVREFQAADSTPVSSGNVFSSVFFLKERIRVNPISLVYTHKRHLTVLEKKKSQAVNLFVWQSVGYSFDRVTEKMGARY